MQPTRWSSAFEILRRRLQRQHEDLQVLHQLRCCRHESDEGGSRADARPEPRADTEAIVARGRHDRE